MAAGARVYTAGSPDSPGGHRGPERAIVQSDVQTIVLVSVHCRQCGYDLRGLSTSSQCPECGLEVSQTLLHLVDPAASRLPKLSDPRGTGDGLLGLAITILIVALLLAVPGAARLFTALGIDPALLVRLGPGQASLLASAISLTAMWWAWILARGPAEAPHAAAHRDLRRLFFGLGAWSLVLAGCGLGMLESPGPIVEVELMVIPLPFAIVSLMGLRGVLELVGLRSRAYRTARSGRQSVDGLVAALLAGAVGMVIRLVGFRMGAGWVEVVGHAITLASTLLLLIGLVYLVVNCWWIRSSLRSPPPTMDELVGRA